MAPGDVAGASLHAAHVALGYVVRLAPVGVVAHTTQLLHNVTM